MLIINLIFKLSITKDVKTSDSLSQIMSISNDHANKIKDSIYVPTRFFNLFNTLSQDILNILHLLTYYIFI